MGEFSPVQLDALEDALEDLELAGIPGGLDDVVGERLGDYRQLLELSREALPMVDVPAGVLDSVLVEARRDAAVVVPAESSADANDAEHASPWWKRLTLWMPVLAVGASAALVLVLVQGTASEAESAKVATAEAPAPHAKEASEAPKEDEPGGVLQQADELQAVAEPPADARADGLGLGDVETRGRLRGQALGGLAQNADADEGRAAPVPSAAEPAAEPAPEPEPKPSSTFEEEDDAEASDKVFYEGKKSKAKKSKPSKVPAKPMPASSGGSKGDAPQPNPGGPSPSSQIAAADGDRRAGRCTAAKLVYRRFEDTGDVRLRAKALAGLGLCAEAAGQAKDAERFFARARKADASIAGFIQRERSAASAKE